MRKNKNLKPFQKGISGNPNGRPPKLPKLDDILAEVMGEDYSGLTTAKRILQMLAKKAVNGDVRAAELLLDRAYGKVKIDLSVNEENKITHITRTVITKPFNPTNHEENNKA